MDGITLREDQLRIARQRFIRPAIFRRHCPHEVAALNDRAWQAYNAQRYRDAVRDFDRVLELEPENPSALRGLLYGTYRQGDYERIESVAQRIERPDQTVGLLADAHLVRGDTAWKTGRIDDARRSYEAVVDLQASEAMSRAASIRMEVLDREPIRDTIMNYLTAVSGHWRMVLSVRDTGDLAPDYGANFYLLGRWLFRSGYYEQALKYLSKADALGLPGEVVRQESLRLQAMAHFYLERYDQSAEVFGRMAALVGSERRGRLGRRGQDRGSLDRPLPVVSAERRQRFRPTGEPGAVGPGPPPGALGVSGPGVDAYHPDMDWFRISSAILSMAVSRAGSRSESVPVSMA